MRTEDFDLALPTYQMTPKFIEPRSKSKKELKCKQTFGRAPSNGSTTQNPFSLNKIPCYFQKLSYPELIKPKGGLAFVNENPNESSILSHNKGKSVLMGNLPHLLLEDVYKEEIEDQEFLQILKNKGSLPFDESRSRNSKDVYSPQRTSFKTFGKEESRVESEFYTAKFAKLRLNSKNPNLSHFNREENASQLASSKIGQNNLKSFSYDYARDKKINHAVTEQIKDLL